MYKPIVQKFIAMRNPNKRDWKALHSFYENLMELDDFLALYPELSREQLARVARCSIHVCNRWFMESETRRSPTEAHRLRFSIAHFVWQMEQIEPPDFQELRQIYREMKKK